MSIPLIALIASLDKSGPLFVNGHSSMHRLDFGLLNIDSCMRNGLSHKWKDETVLSHISGFHPLTDIMNITDYDKEIIRDLWMRVLKFKFDIIWQSAVNNVVVHDKQSVSLD